MQKEISSNGEEITSKAINGIQECCSSEIIIRKSYEAQHKLGCSTK